jgi:aminoglycoside/choline kinase family phosphotransferase
LGENKFSTGIFSCCPNTHDEKRINNNKHFTLIHGNSYIQQFLCLFGETHSKIINFEKFMIGNPAFDLVYLFIERINPAQRNYKDRESKLLKHYHKSLVKFGIKNYSFDELMTDYKLMVSLRIFNALKDYHELGTEDPYWWYKYQNVNHAFIDLKCDELYTEK